MMKIEEGKQYQLADGREYRFLMIDELGERMIGAYRSKDEWVPIVHDMDGLFYGPTRDSVFDLMERPEMQGWYITVRRRVVHDTTIYVQAANVIEARELGKQKAVEDKDLFWEDVTTEHQVVSEEVWNG